MGREKVSAGWKKRVKIEYARLRSQKKFRLQDDIRVAWRNNRVAMKGAHIKKEEEAEKPLQNEQNEVIGERAKPIWICSEDPPRQVAKINVKKGNHNFTSIFFTAIRNLFVEPKQKTQKEKFNQFR